MIVEENTCLHSENGRISFGHDCYVGKGVHIYPSSYYIDENGNECEYYRSSVSLRCRREMPSIHIGDNVLLMERSSICASWIGNNVYIGKGSIIVHFELFWF